MIVNHGMAQAAAKLRKRITRYTSLLILSLSVKYIVIKANELIRVRKTNLQMILGPQAYLYITPG